MYRFLLRPAWIAGILIALIAAGVMVRLGFWQLDRLHDRQARNAAITASMDAEPSPAAQLLPADPTQRPTADAEWMTVTMTGTYLTDDTVLIRQRSFDGGVGFEVVVPLQADDGHIYLVDRGYVITDRQADQVPDIPPPPSGTVTVTGHVRMPYDASDSATRIETIDGYKSVRALSPAVLAESLGLDLSGGYITALAERSGNVPVDNIARIPLPALEDGPHLSYAVQWWLFAALTLGGIGYVVRRESIALLLAEDAEYADDPVDSTTG